MKKLILSLIPLTLILASCNKITEDTGYSYKEAESFEFKYTDDVLSSGELCINESSKPVVLEIPFFSNNYNLPRHMYRDDTDFEIQEIKGSNVSSLDIEFVKSSASELNKQNTLLISALIFNISTKCTETKDVHIEKFVYGYDDSTYYTNTDITIHIVPDAEMLNSEDGLTLFEGSPSNFDSHFRRGYLTKVPYMFEFKNLDDLLPTNEDYILLENVILKSNNTCEYDISIDKNNKKSIVDYDYDGINYKIYKDDRIANRYCYLTINLDIIPDKTKYVYYSLVMTYSFSYDETPRTIILSDVLYYFDADLLDAYYEVFN